MRRNSLEIGQDNHKNIISLANVLKYLLENSLPAFPPFRLSRVATPVRWTIFAGM